MAKAAADTSELSHNLLGQKLGRKGRDTRERIIAAAERLLAGPADAPVSLSAVAREASLGMTTLYLYFSDLTELLMAVLSRVMIAADEAYVGQLRPHWPDEELGAQCSAFIGAYGRFWDRHARVLHLRNALIEQGEARLRDHRMSVSIPLIELIVKQMDGDPTNVVSPEFGMATALITGIERMITVATDARVGAMIEKAEGRMRAVLTAEARLLELGVRDRRAANAAR